MRVAAIATMAPQLVVVQLLLRLLHAPTTSVAAVTAALLLMAASTATAGQPADCPSDCGGVAIPYPFGIDKRCSWYGLDVFTVMCNPSPTPRPYYSVSNKTFEIIDISLEAGELRVYKPVGTSCYDKSAAPAATDDDGSVEVDIDFDGSPFLISPERNVFTATGCDSLALLVGGDSYITGCVTACLSLEAAAKDGDKCVGLGCCQVPSVPANLSYLAMRWMRDITDNIAEVAVYNPCSYTFVTEKNRYNFSRQDFTPTGSKSFVNRGGTQKVVPTVLDWAIRKNGTCSTQSEAPACVSTHSYCANVTNGQGFICNCSKGYAGNPYVTGHGECTDIQECELRKADPAKYLDLYPCSKGSTCHNTVGDYECKCRVGYKRDGQNNKKCRPVLSSIAITILVIICAGVAMIALVCYIFVEREKRKRSMFFDKNGGKLLQSMNISIFTREQLDKMTKNNSNKIGNGAFGEVYMGTTEDNQKVAVKCSIVRGARLGKDEFVNEISIQLQVRHANLVRLVGCCLETDVPMLVFEYVSNGSLEDQLHGAEHCDLPLLERMDIAVGSAEALSYMHSQGRHTIVHGDIKPGNILLGDKLEPKVSDFGSSKLALVTKHQKSFGAISGDMNYIDPAYIKTNIFTEKSDVYSFGVVLLELITRKTARYDGNNSLPINFVKTYHDEDARRTMYDQDMVIVPGAVECLDRIGAIAVQCLKDDVDERPTMAEVAEKLILVRSSVRAFFPNAIGGSNRSNVSIGSNRSNASR